MSNRRGTSSSAALALLLAVLLLGAAVTLLARGRARLEEGAGELRAHNEALSARLAGTLESERELVTELAAERGRGERASAALETSRHALFLARMEAAVRACESGRWVEFDRQLAGVPEEHRGWLWRHLRLRRELAVRAVDLGGREAVAVALSSDGARFAAGAADGSVHVGATEMARVTEVYEALGEEVSALALSPDGSLVAVGVYSGRVGIWSSGDDEPRHEFAGDEGAASLVFAPDGTRLAGAFSDGAVCAWRFGREDEPAWLEGHDFPANAVAFAPDGSRLASAGDDGAVRLHEGADLGAVRVLEGHDDWVRALAFDGRERLVSGAEDGSFVVWDVARGELLEAARIGSAAVVGAAADGRGGLLLVDADGGVRTWRGRDVERSELPLQGAEPMSVAPAVTAEGVVAFVTGRGGALFLCDPARRRARAVLRPEGGAVRAVAASADGGVLVVACADGRLRVLDGRTGAVRASVPAEGGIVRALALSPDGRLAAAGSRAVVVWDTETSEVLLRAREDTRYASLSFSEDGARLLAVGSDGSGHLYDVASGERSHHAPGPPGLVFAVTAGPRARRFAWIGDGGTVRVWDAASGERRAALRVRDLGRVDWLALSADGARLGVVVDGAGVSVLGTGVERSRVRASGPGRGWTYFSIAFSPTGERFACGSYEGRVALFDTASGSFLAELDAGKGGIASLVFTRDGARLVAGSSTGEVYVWGTEREAHERLTR